jgi:PAT family beta-lactamase induction signal transducer AmpG
LGEGGRETDPAPEHCRVTESALDRAKPREGFFSALAVYLRPRVLIVLLLGFSSGLPLALSGATLAIWMTDRGVDLGTIGLFSLVGLPYTFKFVWAPIVDALDVPWLSRALGRRRGWLVFSQLVLAVTIVFLGMLDPVGAPFALAFAALMVAAASATQDIVIDAFRVESLDTSEQAAGMASYVFAYRIGMLVSGAGVIALVAWLEHIGVPREQVWMWGYLAAAAFVAVGLVAALLAREPDTPTEMRLRRPSRHFVSFSRATPRSSCCSSSCCSSSAMRSPAY